LFAKVLVSNEVPFEVQSKDKLANPEGLTIAVEEDHYEDARRLLMKYRKRKTGTHGNLPSG
jgi:DNA topoisomerase VI subunit B